MLPGHPRMSPITGFSVLSLSLLHDSLLLFLGYCRAATTRSGSYVLYKALISLFKLESSYPTTKSSFRYAGDPNEYKDIFIIP